MALVRATQNLTSDRLRKAIKKNTLIMGEEVDLPEETAIWLISKGYAEKVTDKVPADQDGASNPVEKAPKVHKGETPVGSVDVDAEQKDADDARAARFKASHKGK